MKPLQQMKAPQEMEWHVQAVPGAATCPGRPNPPVMAVLDFLRCGVDVRQELAVSLLRMVLPLPAQSMHAIMNLAEARSPLHRPGIQFRPLAPLLEPPRYRVYRDQDR